MSKAHDVWTSLLKSVERQQIQSQIQSQIQQVRTITVPFSPEKKKPGYCPWCGEKIVQRDKSLGGKARQFCNWKHGYLFRNYMKRKWKGN